MPSYGDDCSLPLGPYFSCARWTCSSLRPVSSSAPKNDSTSSTDLVCASSIPAVPPSVVSDLSLQRCRRRLSSPRKQSGSFLLSVQDKSALPSGRCMSLRVLPAWRYSPCVDCRRLRRLRCCCCCCSMPLFLNLR